MSLENQVLKITHDELDEPHWNATYGWIPRNDLPNEIIKHLCQENHIEDREGFQVEVYELTHQDMMMILDGKEADGEFEVDYRY